MARALLIVDEQNDFCEGGSLAVTGGRKVCEDTAAYVREHGAEYDLIVTSQDWHTPHSTNGGHFAAEGTDPDFKDTWPAHCVRGTEGSYLDTTLVNSLSWVSHSRQVPVKAVLKGQDAPAYSAFQGTEPIGTNHAMDSLGQAFARHDITEVDVCGLALDYCVKATVLDALDLGLKTRLLTDLTAAVTPETGKDALGEMVQAGFTAGTGLYVA